MTLALTPRQQEICAELKKRGLIGQSKNGFALPHGSMELDNWFARYFPEVLSSPMSPEHEEIWEWIEGMGVDDSPGTLCAFLARGGGKSTTIEVGLARICAKLSRRYVLYISDTQDQADTHVQSVEATLSAVGAEPLISKLGRVRAWRRNQMRTANGFNIAAFGLDGAARGTKIEHFRPDLMIFDDVDRQSDSPYLTKQKIEAMTLSALPAGAPNCAVLFIQNLVAANSIASRLDDGRADFLLNRRVIKAPAVRGLTYEEDPIPEGIDPLTVRNRTYHITGGIPSWQGRPLSICELQLNTWGLGAFLREAQHEVKVGVTFFTDWNVLLHIPKANPFTPLTGLPSNWTFFGGLDWGYADPFAFVLKGVDEHGTIHGIESVQREGLTNEAQAKLIVDILKRWGVPLKRCTIGFDQSMRNKRTINGVQAEADIEAFYRAGLNCVAADKASINGYMVLRGILEKYNGYKCWRGWNIELAEAYGAAQYDQKKPEMLAHDASSHFISAEIYSMCVRPAIPKGADRRGIPDFLKTVDNEHKVYL